MNVNRSLKQCFPITDTHYISVLIHQLGMGSVPDCAPKVKPFSTFPPKINRFGTRKIHAPTGTKEQFFSMKLDDIHGHVSW